MRIRAALFTLAVAAALTGCSSSGASGELAAGPGAGQTAAATGGGGPTTSPSVPAESAGDGGQASGSSGDGGDGPGGFCTKLKTAQTNLQGLLSNGGDPAEVVSAMDKEISVYASLKKGAPADVAPAIDDVLQVLTGAKAAYADPGSADPSDLKDVATRLPQDAQKIASYVGSHCAGS